MYTVTYKKLDGGEVEFVGEIAADAFDGYRSHALEHLGANIEVPGFRKGKAPENVLEKQIPEMAILEEMANHAIMDAYPKMIREHNVDAIGAPAVQITKIARGNPLGFIIKTAVLPEIALPDYKKIAKETATEVKTEVTDAEFEESLKQVSTMRAQGIKENKEKQAAEGGESNEKKDEAAPAPEKPEELPELTDEYVQTLGDFKDVEDFKAKFRENLRLEKEHREHEKNRLTIMEKILEGTKASIPSILIEAELDRMMYRMKADITGMGLSYEDYLKHLNKEEKVIREEFRTDAEKRVKMELIIDEIAKKENVQPEAEEVEKQIVDIMAQYPGADRERAKSYVEQVMINEKVFKLLEGTK